MNRNIVTARLNLQPMCLDDFDDYARMMCEPEVILHFGTKPLPRPDVWTRTLAQIGHWHSFGYGYWSARDHSGRFAGIIGFAKLERGVVPDFGDAPEVGYMLSAWAHGQGYASEAMLATHDWLYAKIGKLRTVAMIDPDNTPSIRLANRFGYTEFARSTFKEAPIALFERLI